MKGIVFSFFTVMVFLPAVTLSLYKLIDKTRHRLLMPSFKNVGKVLSKVRVPALVLVLALVVPAFLGQSHTVLTYQNSEPDPNLRAGADTLMIQDEFGQQNAVVVLVPRGDVAAEAALSRDLAEVDHVTGVISYASTVGAAIRRLPRPERDRPVLFAELRAHHRLHQHRCGKRRGVLHGGSRAAGGCAPLRHVLHRRPVRESLRHEEHRAVDNVVVSAVAIIAILIVLLVTFRSLTLPLVLPPTVVGYLLLRVLGPKRAVGAWALAHFNLKLTMVWWSGDFRNRCCHFPAHVPYGARCIREL